MVVVVMMMVVVVVVVTGAGAEIFISGESYAGAYIPWIAQHIVQEQIAPPAAPAVDQLTPGVTYRDVAAGTGTGSLAGYANKILHDSKLNIFLCSGALSCLGKGRSSVI